jgi:hypothetical protein
MGWWKDKKDEKEVWVGDEGIDSAIGFLKDLTKFYEEDHDRRPKLDEVLRVLELTFQSVGYDYLHQGDRFELKFLKANVRERAKRQAYRAGDVFAVPFRKGKWVYGQILWNSPNMGPLTQFYDFTTTTPKPLNDVSKLKKLFYIYASDEGLINREWPIVGHVATTMTESELPPFVVDDAGLLEIGDRVIRDATTQEKRRLPFSAIWSVEAIHEKLRNPTARNKPARDD